MWLIFWHKVSESIACLIGLAYCFLLAMEVRQIPLHVWLPESMEGPTPIPLIHAPPW